MKQFPRKRPLCIDQFIGLRAFFATETTATATTAALNKLIDAEIDPNDRIRRFGGALHYQAEANQSFIINV